MGDVMREMAAEVGEAAEAEMAGGAVMVNPDKPKPSSRQVLLLHSSKSPST
jgi:hypothetical protein